jgi:hypothetical protein
VSDKTSLTAVALSTGSFVGEKARISSSVVMDGARVEPGVVLQVANQFSWWALMMLHLFRINILVYRL